LNVVPKIERIADGNGIAFAALDILGDVLAADSEVIARCTSPTVIHNCAAFRRFTSTLM